MGSSSVHPSHVFKFPNNTITCIPRPSLLLQVHQTRILRQWFEALDVGNRGRLSVDVLEQPLMLLGVISSKDELVYVLKKKQAEEQQKHSAISGDAGVTTRSDHEDELSLDWLGFLDILIPNTAKFSKHELNQYTPQVEELLTLFDSSGAQGWDGSKPPRNDAGGVDSIQERCTSDGVDFEHLTHQFARVQMIDSVISCTSELMGKHDHEIRMHQAAVSGVAPTT